MDKDRMYFSKLIDENSNEEQDTPRSENDFAKIEEAKINDTRSRRRFSSREVRIICIPAAIVIIAVIVALLFYRKVNTYTVSDSAFQPYLIETEIKKGTKLSVDSDGEVIMDSDENGSIIKNVPLYYKDKNSIVLPNDEIYYAPVTGIPGKIDYFTEIELDEDGNVYASKDNDRISLQGGFIFDGRDFYVFLVPVELKYNGKSMELPALSYVEAIYQDDILIYNHDTGEYVTEPVTTDVIANYGSDYSVNLLSDSMTASDGNKNLLFTRADLLDSVFAD